VNRSDTLNFAIYTRHGDSCCCQSMAPNTCASKCNPDDYVLAARFSYLQEALEVIEKWNKRGVSCKLRSPSYTTPRLFNWSDYTVKTLEVKQ
jgi:hypothetical protein